MTAVAALLTAVVGLLVFPAGRRRRRTVSVAEKEIDEKAREWESRPDRPGRPKSDKAS